MNRGSSGADEAAQAAQAASMRPRFMNRGSAAVELGLPALVQLQ